MATSNSWSVVGKPKKATGKSSPLTKTQRKQFLENMPRIERKDPVQESSTIYDAFVQKEQQRYEKKSQEKFASKLESSREPNGKGISDGGLKKKTKPVKKEQSQKKKPFEDAVKLVTEEELKSILLQSKGHFPDKPELWLKDLVTYLNVKLEICPDTDKFLNKGNTDFPASSLKKACSKVLTSALHDCNTATLEHILLFCVNSMLDEHQRGISTYGYKIFIQLLARSNPQLVLAKLDLFQDIVKSTQNRPDRCLLVLWCLGQAGFPSLKAGLRVWFDVMFPLLSLKALSGYCLQYLEAILSLHSKRLDSGLNEIKMQEYFKYLDCQQSSSWSGDIRKRLQALYPQIKEIKDCLETFERELHKQENLLKIQKLAINETSKSTTLRAFFPSYLVRANIKNQEVMSCLVECLSVDQQSFSLWCQFYLKHLPQSRQLLQYLCSRWDKLSSRIDKKLMQQTLMTFLRTNDESTHIRNANELADMSAVCEEFLKKMVRPRFPWRWVVFFLVTAVIGVVVYDVLTSKTLKECKIVRFLEMYGILGVLDQIWTAVCGYTDLSVRWLQVNVPVYYERVSVAVSPLVARLQAAFVYMEENTRDFRHAAINKVYGLAPNLWDDVGRYLVLVKEFIVHYAHWILAQVATLYKYVYHWVDVNVINGDISSQTVKETLSWSASKVQNMTVSAFHWCSRLWT